MDMTRLRRPGPCCLAALLVITLVTMPASGHADDSALNLDAYRGQVVLLDFWASWCVPCRRSFPWMNQMQQKYGGQGLVIIGVNMDASTSDAEAFLRDYPAQFTIVSDPDGTLARQFEVEAMPSSYLIGRDGVIASRHLGFQVRQADEYEATIREVLLSQKE